MTARNIGRQLLRYGTTLLLASVAIFVTLRIVPGNPAEIALGVNATAENVEKLSAEMGLDAPAWQQYLGWVGGMLRGDFGTSIVSGADISEMVVDRLQVSLILVLVSMAVALTIATPLGIWAARRANSIDGALISAFSQVGIAVPSFLSGILLVAAFAVHLGWLPPNGWVVPRQDPAGFVARLVLPALALGIVQAAIMARYIRSAILDVINDDYMRTARAIGLSQGQALRRHGLRNAALPVLTITGMQLTSLLIGAVVIEKVFVIPGLGSLLLSAVTNRDLPTVQTTVMLLVVLTVVVNAITDITYTLVDPRTARTAR